ncbi:Sas10/Utp3/C1D family/Sas10 C-terminal domain containing protein [Novymonas esmeraldas]|uniref:Sas10/Utp3/C1D family/Sas10 C-terminal domain containing protein n=1 Tax=Novymonas esmeraldas TaxID=1808958 RepID=A0AAW0F5A4_9TRYP
MVRGAKGAKKRSRKEASDTIVEDLDLDVADVSAYADDEDVVHNRRGGKAARADGIEEADVFAVLPSDAHRLDGYGDDEHGGFQEEEELAVLTEKGLRRKTTEDDFNVAGVSVAQASSRREAAAKRGALDSLDAAPVIEAVERDFAALTTAERLAVLKKESPELLKLLEDLKTYMAEVKTLAQPLHDLLYQRKVSASDKNLVSFLETKVQLMLSYCMHVTFYLLLKSEGRKVAGHPVIDHLVEIRVYLEKMWPLEEKLQYSLNRLLSGKSTSAAHIAELRPLQSGDGGAFASTRAMQNTEARERRQQLRVMKDAEELEREEQAAMTRVRTKRASALNSSSIAASAIAPVSYQEDEDQFFSRIAAGGDGDGDADDSDGGEEGLSLMEVLRRRQKKSGDVLGRQRTSKRSAKAAAAAAADDSADEDQEDDGADEMLDMAGDGESDADGAGADDDGDDEDYEAVWDEERARQAAESSRKAASTAAATARRAAPEDVERRKAGKKIESHRGLTKARPKDRKNPRVAQRRKYERGMQVHKSQSRSFQPQPEGGFTGVRSVRPGVLRGTKL